MFESFCLILFEQDSFRSDYSNVSFVRRLKQLQALMSLCLWGYHFAQRNPLFGQMNGRWKGNESDHGLFSINLKPFKLMASKLTQRNPLCFRGNPRLGQRGLLTTRESLRLPRLWKEHEVPPWHRCAAQMSHWIPGIHRCRGNNTNGIRVGIPDSTVACMASLGAPLGTPKDCFSAKIGVSLLANVLF